MIIAVDPGESGGIAWCDNKGLKTGVAAMPATRGDTIDLFKGILSIGWAPPHICYHEKVSPFIPDGGASMMFAFGASAERCGCIAETLGVKLVDIPPKAWQARLGLGRSERIKVPNKGTVTPEEIKAAKAHNQRAKIQWKNKLKETAQHLFPDIKVTLKTSDALLILEVAKSEVDKLGFNS
jgi:hypothetical protein